MPFTAADADRHNHSLTAPQRRQWVKVANSVLDACLADGGTDESCAPKAIQQANGVVKKVAEDAAPTLYTHVLKEAPPLRYTLGIVYAPLEEDLQGDFAKAATIQKAAWEFMRRLQQGKTLTKWAMALLDAVVKAVEDTTPIRLDVTGMVEEITKTQRLLGDQHQSWDEGLGDVVESYVMPCDWEIGDHVVKQGTWLLGVIWSPAYFTKIQSGVRTGYSMGGKGRRQWVEEMSLAV